MAFLFKKKSDFFEQKERDGKGSLFENVTDILYITNNRFFTDHWFFLFRETGKITTWFVKKNVINFKKTSWFKKRMFF